MKIGVESIRNFQRATFDKNGLLDEGPKSSKLVLRFEGTDVTNQLMNCIRRTILSFVPIYAFSKTNIEITKNTTNLNNDIMRLKISQLPIFNHEHNIKHLESKYWEDLDAFVGDKIKMAINVHNTSSGIVNVTTDNITIEINGKQMLNLYDNVDKILIMQISPKGEFVCEAIANVGIGFINDIYSSGLCYYDDVTQESQQNKIKHTQNTNKQFVLTIRSNGQMTEGTLLKKTFEIIKINVDLVINKMKVICQQIGLSETQFRINLENEDYTFTNVINYYLQNHSNVTFCGLIKENHHIDIITFEIKTSAANVMINILDNVANEINAVVDKMAKQIDHLKL